MTRVPANRFLLFGLIAAAGFFGDLFSKDVVFTDLGCTTELGPPEAPRRIHIPGEHRIFAHAEGWEGRSVAYLDGWVSFRLFTSFNEGALWGVGQGYAWLFSGLSVVAGVGVVCWLFVWGAARSLWLTVSLAFIMAGTLGNLWDRLGLHGYQDTSDETVHAVRDFLLFTFGDWHYPVFNFADVFLVTGAVMLVLQSMKAERHDGSAPQEQTTASVAQLAAGTPSPQQQNGG